MRNRKLMLIATTVLCVAGGLAVVLYPFVSNSINKQNQAQIIDVYDDVVGQMEEETIAEEKELSSTYNKNLLGNLILTDPFDPDAEKDTPENYEARLNLTDDGVMGHIEIPRINVSLPIYHGTDRETLDKGVGHLPNSSLPVGGETTHAVLSAHTGYAKSTFFNRLTELEEGDMFYVKVLGETLAYKVDQIKVVDPEDTSDLLISSGEDYMTLVTCTPYGVNTHRLLVRGTRIPYVVEESSWLKEVLQLSFSSAAVLLLIILISVLAVRDIYTIRRFRKLHTVQQGKRF